MSDRPGSTGWVLGMGILLCLIQSCNPIFKLIVGAKSPYDPDPAELEHWTGSLGIGNHAVYTLDTSFWELIDRQTKSDLSKKMYKQPLLILSFVNGHIVSANNNCSFPGLPTIHWNEFGTFDQFPPASSYPDSTFGILDYSDLRAKMIPFNAKAMGPQPDQDTAVVVVISRAYHRQSKALVQTILSQYPGRKDKILFVNNDAYIYYKLDTGFH